MSKCCCPILIGAFVVAAIAYTFCVSQNTYITDFDTHIFKEEARLHEAVKKDTADKVRLDSLFNVWHEVVSAERKELQLTKQNEERSHALWLAVIAAVCTVLPVVLAINQSRENEQLAEDMKAKLEETKEESKQLHKDIDKLKGEIGEQKQRQQLRQNLSTISQVIRTLCDMQQLENKHSAHLNKRTVALLKLLATTTRSAAGHLTQSEGKASSEGEALTQAAFVALCSIRNMLYQYDNVFTERLILKSQTYKDSLNSEIDTIVKIVNDNRDVPLSETIDMLRSVASAANGIYRLMSSQFESCKPRPREAAIAASAVAAGA